MTKFNEHFLSGFYRKKKVKFNINISPFAGVKLIYDITMAYNNNDI